MSLESSMSLEILSEFQKPFTWSYIVMNYDFDIIIKLIESTNLPIDQQDKFGHTLLYRAVDHCNINQFDLLMTLNPNVNCADFIGSTPLMLACLRLNPYLVENLLEKKADPNMTNNNNDTALMMVCGTLMKFDDDILLKIVKLLVDYKAKLNVTNKSCTPLNLAIYTNKTIIVKYLLQFAEVKETMKENCLSITY